MNYGKGIALARERAGLSKRKLAAATGFDASYIGQLESGKRTPSLDALEKIANATNTPMPILVLSSAEKQDLQGLDADEARTLINLLLNLWDASYTS